MFSTPVCPECGKELKSTQAVRGHRFFAHGQGRKYSEAPRGAPPPQPEEPVKSVYKPLPPPLTAQLAQPIQPPPLQPATPAAPPPLRVERVVERVLEKGVSESDVKEIVSKTIEEELLRIPSEAEKKTGEQIRDIFQEHDRKKREKSDVSELKESIALTNDKMNSLFRKIRNRELAWQKAPTQPTEPMLTPYQLELQAKQIGEKIGFEAAQKMLGEKTKGVESEGGEAGAQKVDETQKEEGVKGEMPREELPSEAAEAVAAERPAASELEKPARISPILRRRRRLFLR